MLSFFRKRKATDAFEIDTPRLTIASNMHDPETILMEAKVEYRTVTKGYIVFEGYVFGSDFPLMIGIHFNAFKVEYIEIFRPMEYYRSGEYDIQVSFAELSDLLKKQYGNPLITKPTVLFGYPHERWRTPNYLIDHYIMDRFGPEEHLHICFHRK